MKTLSLLTEYAYLVCSGVKLCEGRNWRPKDIPGKIYIHSSGGISYPYIPVDAIGDFFWESWDSAKESGSYSGVIEAYKKYVERVREFHRVSAFSEIEIEKCLKDERKCFCRSSAIIGEASIYDIVNTPPSGIELSFTDKGWKWYFLLKDAILYDKPICGVAGKLGFWDYTKE